MGYVSVAISGQPGSGKSTLASEIVEKTAWKPLSMGGMWRAKHAKLYPNNEVSFEDYWRGTTREDNLKMNIDAKKVVEAGGIVMDSRFVSYLDRDLVLRLRLIADLDKRVGRLRKSDRKDYSDRPIEEIKKSLRKREADEVKTGFDLFGVDYRTPSHYDIVIDSGKMTVKEEVLTAMHKLLEKRK